MNPTCGHCRRPMRGSAWASGVPLCHPDEGLDCYRLVTIYGHPIPCPGCRGAGDDGLTDAERTLLAIRYEATGARRPTRTEVDELRERAKARLAELRALARRRMIETGANKPHISCRSNGFGPYWWAMHHGQIIAGSTDPRKLALAERWPEEER